MLPFSVNHAGIGPLKPPLPAHALAFHAAAAAWLRLAANAPLDPMHKA